jgi:hypothetical protein
MRFFLLVLVILMVNACLNAGCTAGPFSTARGLSVHLHRCKFKVTTSKLLAKRRAHCEAVETQKKQRAGTVPNAAAGASTDVAPEYDLIDAPNVHFYLFLVIKF